MIKGQSFTVTTDVKMQEKSFKAGTTFKVYMVAENHEKENHTIVVCNKNGEMKSLNNPKNFVGINQKQVDFALENGNIVFN